MLKVTVEIWPFGDSDQRRTLAEMFIINDGTGNIETGNYDVRAYGAEGLELLGVGRVTGHLRALPVLDLVRKSIESCAPQPAGGVE